MIEPAKSRARIPCFQGVAADFPGDCNGQAGVGARTRQSARRHPKGAGPLRYGAIPDRGDDLQASAIEPKSRARIQCFQSLAARFPGDRNGQSACWSGTCQAPRRRCGAIPDRGDGLQASAIEPAKSRARIPCFQGLAASFPGDRNSRAGVGARTRQRARRHTRGARPRRYGAIPERDGVLQASAIDPAKSRARIQCFQSLAGGFPGGRNGQGAYWSGTCQAPRRRCGPCRASKDARLSTGFGGVTIQANVGRPGSRGSPCRPSGSPRRRTRGAWLWSDGMLPFRPLRFSKPSFPRMRRPSGAER